VLSCAWFGGFLAISNSNAPTPPPPESDASRSVRRHFTTLAVAQRKLLEVDQYYGSRHESGAIDAIVDFTEPSSIPPWTIGLDGFLPKHVDIAQGENGICTINAVFTRRPPYAWPRTLDITLGKDRVERVDREESYASKEIAFYRLNNSLRLDLESPNGQFTWEISNDKALMMSPRCLFRQDLYKEGEWVKSLIAVAK